MRKVHVRNHSALAGRVAALYMHGVVADDDIRTLLKATHRDSEGELTGSEAQYGSGQLAAGVVAGGQTITVAVSPDWPAIFRSTDSIIISSQEDPNGPGGQYQIMTLNSASYNGGTGIWTLATDEQLALDYSALDSFVGSIIEYGDWEPAVEDATVASTAGTFDEGQVVLGAGTESETYSLDFTNATAFTITGDTLGALGSYTVGATAAPVHPTTGETLLSIPAAAWGGTFANGDGVELVTTPADMPVWFRREIKENGTASFLERTSIAYLTESVE
jgi:hypothetical protein